MSVFPLWNQSSINLRRLLGGKSKGSKTSPQTKNAAEHVRVSTRKLHNNLESGRQRRFPRHLGALRAGLWPMTGCESPHAAEEPLGSIRLSSLARTDQSASLPTLRIFGER